MPRAERLPSEAIPDAPDAGAVGVRSTFDRAERLVLAGPKPPEGGIGGGGVPSQVGSRFIVGGTGTPRTGACEGEDCTRGDDGIGGGSTCRLLLRAGGETTWADGETALLSGSPKMAALAPASGTRSPLPLTGRSRSVSRVRIPAGMAACIALFEKPPGEANAAHGSQSSWRCLPPARARVSRTIGAIFDIFHSNKQPPIQTRQFKTSRRPNPRPAQQPQPRSLTLPAADSEGRGRPQRTQISPVRRFSLAHWQPLTRVAVQKSASNAHPAQEGTLKDPKNS